MRKLIPASKVCKSDELIHAVFSFLFFFNKWIWSLVFKDSFMWIIFKVFIELVVKLLLFYVLGFWSGGM